MSMADWLKQNVTSDSKALEWFDGPECEDRIVRAYRELLSGYETDTATILKTTCFVEGSHPGVITIRDINFSSICAHHFLPFFGTVEVHYAPGNRILGLGKFPRLVRAYSRRFQIQEYLVRDIAEEILSSGGARAVLVRSRGRHMCMCGRGPSDPTVMTETSYVAGDRDVLAGYGCQLAA